MTTWSCFVAMRRKQYFVYAPLLPDQHVYCPLREFTCRS